MYISEIDKAPINLLNTLSKIAIQVAFRGLKTTDSKAIKKTQRMSDLVISKWKQEQKKGGGIERG